MAQNRNESILWLEVLKTNIGAQRFYTANGFQSLAELPFRTDIAEIQMVVMARYSFRD
ncbi:MULTISPECIES: hypothetical protein [unclassified Pseudomonas]|uniref:hypothetical protein n=1 Tax=Pseudomonas imrae TaxID=2992837 RepID=UPI003965B8FF